MIETGGERLTSTGLAIGTPVYMSPEQASAQAVDARTDQYSLACVLYEMLVGEPPFTGPTAQAVVARRLAEPARAIRPVRASVPASAEMAVLRALERIPADRFADVSTFARALRSTPAPTQAPARPAARPARSVLIGAVVLVVAGLAAWLVGHRPTTAPVERDPEAVALYQRGMHESAKRTPAGAVEAIRALSAAVRRDSTYTEAWAGLAKTYTRAYGRRFALPGMAPDSILRLAVAAADRALAGNRRSPEAWKAQAIVTRMVDPTDLAPAIRSLRQALAIDSSDAEAWHNLAVSLAESDDLDEALEDWRRSVAADPTYAEGLAFLGLGHYWRRQYDSAAHWADSAITVEPNYLLGRSTVGYIAIERGDYRRARAAFEAARRLTTDIEAMNSAAGTALADARAGALPEARDMLQQAESKAIGYAATSLHTSVFMAQAHAAVGATDRAIAWLRRYTPSNDLHFQLHLRCDPPFDPIAADPGFRALLLAPRPAGSEGC